MDMTGKTVWITGASSGIGAALATAVARAGARVILSGRRADALHEVAGRCQAQTLVLPFETTDLDVLPGIVAQAEAWSGGIDILVNNAGISQRSLARDTSFDVYRQIMEVDYFAPLRLTQLVLPAMRARGSGAFVAISSLAGKFGSPLRTGYCSAKFALIGYFDALRAETAHEGIEVFVVTPGFVKTAIAANALTADGSVRGRSDDNIDAGITADEAAQQIIDGMTTGRREIPVGRGPEMAMLDLLRANPDQIFDLMAAQGKAIANAATLP
ncbi:MAG: SDR family NAD(P)-dependent oxidoreductase [Polymorphobacter sp.]